MQLGRQAYTGNVDTGQTGGRTPDGRTGRQAGWEASADNISTVHTDRQAGRHIVVTSIPDR